MQKLKRVLKNYNFYLSVVLIGLSVILGLFIDAVRFGFIVDVPYGSSIFGAINIVIGVSTVAYLVTCPKSKLNKILVGASLVFALAGILFLVAHRYQETRDLDHYPCDTRKSFCDI